MSTAIVIIIVLAVFVFALRSTVNHFRGKGSGCCGSADYKARKKRLAHVAARRRFHVEGMMCQNCVNRVMEQINSIPGASAAVDLRRGTVTVSMESEMPDSLFVSAIEKAGYEVKGAAE